MGQGWPALQSKTLFQKEKKKKLQQTKGMTEYSCMKMSTSYLHSTAGESRKPACGLHNPTDAVPDQVKLLLTLEARTTAL